MIFLYRFDVNGNGIDFVLNEGIAEDMSPEYELVLKPIIESTCETLMRYKCFSKGNPIMTGTILDTSEFEVMLSEGLGKYINPYEKNLLFEAAKLIADILVLVMERRGVDKRQ